VGTLDAAANVFLGRELHRGGPLRLLDRPRMEADTARQLARIGAPIAPRAIVRQLSTAQQQFVAIARALSMNARLLVLDEPTASLDPEATWEFRTLVEQLRRENVTILLCSHLLAEVERVADRVLILVDGRRAALERLDTLRARQARASRLAIDVDEPAAQSAALAALGRSGIRVVLRESSRLVLEAEDGNGLDAVAALDTLLEAGVPVRGFEVERPTLEELFLDVVRATPRRAEAASGVTS
jgi:ribose transport system ATP-binding protein